MPDLIAPGGTVGILGGGQLGRMLAMAAARLGLKAHIYCPETNPPAGDVAAHVTTANYDDLERLAAFADTVDVVTYEFENVPAKTVETLLPLVPVRPGARALEISQDRLFEKQFITSLGLSVAPFAPVEGEASMAAAIEKIGAPAILKTRRFGYDGKGQLRLRSVEEAPDALDYLKGAPAVLEGFVEFRREISVIGARGIDGAVSCYDAGENVHKDGILHTTTLPAEITGGQMMDAALLTGKILNALDYVGVIGVELFDTSQGLVVNEYAPRVHNSGHWTIEACAIDQFEQHIRAICGWPLGDGSRHSDAVMTNLIGADAHEWWAFAGEQGAGVHLYGKGEARAGRKMGHVTRISPKT